MARIASALTIDASTPSTAKMPTLFLTFRTPLIVCGGEIFRDHRSSFGLLAKRHDAQGPGKISILHPSGLYHFKRMPFGLSNAPATLCRLMHSVLRDHLWHNCLCYLDDVIVYATSQQELLERLHTILSCLHNVGLKVKPSKCSLFKERISFLGHMVLAAGIDPQEEKIQSIQD